MGSITKYYCDRCGKKMSHSNRPALSFGCGYDTYDMCESCAKKFKTFMGKAEGD